MSERAPKISRTHIFLFLLLYTIFSANLEYLLFEYCRTATFTGSLLSLLFESFLLLPIVITLIVSLLYQKTAAHGPLSEENCLGISGGAAFLTLLSYGICCMAFFYHFYHNSLVSSEGLLPAPLASTIYSILFPLLFVLYAQGQLLYTYPIGEVLHFPEPGYVYLLIPLYLIVILVSFIASLYCYRKYKGKHTLYFASILGGLLSLFCVAQVFAHRYPYDDIGDGGCGNAINRIGAPLICGPTVDIE